LNGDTSHTMIPEDQSAKSSVWSP